MDAKKERKLVSVVIPTYNRKVTLGASIDSVLNQTYGHLELIIVDDASTDGTRELVESYEDARIVYIYNEQRTGANNARNKGILASSGKYIAFNDSDDLWLPGKLERQLQYMDDRAGMVFSTYFFEDSTGYRKAILPQFRQDETNKELMDILAQRNIVSNGTMLIRRDCLQAVGLFDSEMPRHQDYELVIRIVQRFPVVYIDEPMVQVNHTTGSISDDYGALFQAIVLMLKKHGHFFEERNAVEAHMLLGLRKCREQTDMYGYCISFLMKELGNKYQKNIFIACAAAMQELAVEERNCRWEILRLKQVVDCQVKRISRRIKRGEAFHIYGAGKYACDLYGFLKKHEVKNFRGFIVSETNISKSEIDGFPIKTVRDMAPEEKTSPVLIATASKYHEEIMKMLVSCMFSDFVPAVKERLEQWFDEDSL